MKSKRISTAGSEPGSSAEEHLPTLPAWKAFVVQFSRETNPQTGRFSGRVEHMTSGRRARFASSQELVSALEKMLDKLGDKPT